MIKQTTRALLIFLITFLLLIPVVICNIISTPSIRIIVIMLSTISYLFILSELTKSKTIELILAGATWGSHKNIFGDCQLIQLILDMLPSSSCSSLVLGGNQPKDKPGLHESGDIQSIVSQLAVELVGHRSSGNPSTTGCRDQTTCQRLYSSYLVL